MKTYNSKTTIASILVFIATSFSSFVQAQSNVHYSPQYKQASVGIAANSYEVPKSREFSAQEADQILKRVIAYVNAPIDENSTWITAIDGNIKAREGAAYANMNLRTGELSVINWHDKYNGKEDTRGLLSGSDAVDKAIQDLKHLGLLPEDINELYVDSIGGVNVATAKEYGIQESHKVITTVRFKRKIDGLPVHGASRIIVYLGEKGRLDGIIYRWPKIEKKPLERIAAKNAVELQNDIHTHLKHYESEVKSVEIKTSNYVLYDDGNGVIEPAIYVEGKLISKAGFEAPVQKYIPVMKTSKALFPHVVEAALLLFANDDDMKYDNE